MGSQDTKYLLDTQAAQLWLTGSPWQCAGATYTVGLAARAAQSGLLRLCGLPECPQDPDPEGGQLASGARAGGGQAAAGAELEGAACPH